MSRKGKLEGKLARLRQEIERLSTRQAEKIRRQDSSADSMRHELEARRAQILERRKRQLEEMLDVLRHEEQGSD